jgi:hypothetical protein
VSRRAAATAALVCLALLAGAAPALASEAMPETGRVLVISIPGLTWKALEDPALSHLRQLAEQSAVANLSPRVRSPRTPPGDAYATLGSGTETLAPSDIAGMVLGAREEFENGTAAEAYRRRTGDRLGGAAGHVRIPALRSVNESSQFRGTVGVVGEALAAGHVRAGAVGNADQSLDPETTGHRREVALSMVDEHGALACGRVDGGLLQRDPEMAFGLRLSLDRTLAAFRECWHGRATVVVEASDLRRATDYRGLVSPPDRDAITQRAYARTNTLVRALLREVDPARDAVVLIAPTPPPTGAPHLTVFALRAPGIAPGLLESDTTRQPGYVTIVDVAPTLARLAGAPLDESAIEGRSVRRASTGGAAEKRLEGLVHADDAARFRDRALPTVASIFVGLVLACAFFLVAALFAGRVPHRVFELMAFTVLAALPLTYVAGLLPFRDWGLAAYIAFVFGGGAAAALGLRRLALPAALVILGTASIGITALSVGVMHSRLHLSTVFGDSPIIAGRFSGINNVTFAQLMAWAIVLAVLAVRRWPGRTGTAAMVALFLFVVVLDGAPTLGADVGGVLGGLPALALAAVLLSGSRVRVRHVVTFLLLTAGAIAAFGLLDVTTSSSNQSHLGRLIERIGAQGSEGFTTVVSRKWSAAVRTVTSSVWRFLPLPVVALGVVVVWKLPDVADQVRAVVPRVEGALVALGVAAFLGFALNDSGIAVPGMMAAVITPIAVLVTTGVTRD